MCVMCLNWIIYLSNTSHTRYKRIGYVIIPKPNFSHREGINSRRRRFDGSLAINCDQSYRRLGYRWRSTEHSRSDSVFVIVFEVFFC